MDQYFEITKEIVLAMIDKNYIYHYKPASEGIEANAIQNSKAIAAAFETIYAGLVDTANKQR